MELDKVYSDNSSNGQDPQASFLPPPAVVTNINGRDELDDLFPPPLTPIKKLRDQLWQNGYRPLAVYDPEAPVRNAGKRPVGAGWEERARQNPPAAFLDQVRPDARNTGILPDGLRAFHFALHDDAV